MVQRVFVPMKGNEPDEAKVAALLAGLEKTLDVLDSHLAKQDYLAGEHYLLIIDDSQHKIWVLKMSEVRGWGKWWTSISSPTPPCHWGYKYELANLELDWYAPPA